MFFKDSCKIKEFLSLILDHKSKFSTEANHPENIRDEKNQKSQPKEL